VVDGGGGGVVDGRPDALRLVGVELERRGRDEGGAAVVEHAGEPAQQRRVVQPV